MKRGGKRHRSRVTTSNSRYRQQRKFIFGCKSTLEPVYREDIYDAKHIFPQVDEIIDLLKSYSYYQEKGIELDSGVNLCGPAGTGKTTLARHIATVSKVYFVDAREFPVELRNGIHLWQPRDVKNLFKLSESWAKQNNCPIVLFIDQIDTWIKVHQNVVDQFEIELEGMAGRKRGVFIISTSQEKLKSSLFRKGRIGKRIVFPLPDSRQKHELLEGFVGCYPHEKGIDIKNLPYLLDRPSHATLKICTGEAYKLAEKENKLARNKGRKTTPPRITEEYLIKVFLQESIGDKTGYTLSKKDEWIVAVHETGHAVVGRALGIPVRFISVEPTIGWLGVTFTDVDEGRIISLEELKFVIAKNLGGLAAQKLLNISADMGRISDLEIASGMALELVALYGERKLMMRGYDLFVPLRIGEKGELELMAPIIGSEKLKMAVEKDSVTIFRNAHRRADRIMKFFGSDILTNIARRLIEKPNKVMLQQEIDSLLEPKLTEYRTKHKIRNS